MSAKSNLADRRFERILVIKPSSVGDIVHALPVLHGLRVRWPSARIGWLVASHFAELLEGHPELDEVIPFDRRRFGRLGRSIPVSVEFAEFVQSLRARSFDLVIDLQGLFRSGFLAMATGAGVRIGFPEAREFGWLFYTHRVEVPTSDMHAADRNYQVGGMLGFGHVPMEFRLRIGEAPRGEAAQFLAEAGLPPGQPYAALIPAARWETKLWAPDRFAAVADALQKDWALRVVLVTSAAHKPIAEAIADLTATATINLAGATTLKQMLALLEAASIVVTNDSGPMHMAAALGRPLVAIYGPTNPTRTGPYNRPRAVVRAELPCSPCYIRKLSQCPHKQECMNRVTVDDVLAVVSRELADAGARASSAAFAPGCP